MWNGGFIDCIVILHILLVHVVVHLFCVNKNLRMDFIRKNQLKMEALGRRHTQNQFLWVKPVSLGTYVAYSSPPDSSFCICIKKSNRRRDRISKNSRILSVCIDSIRPSEMYKSYSYIVCCFLLMLVTVVKSSGSTVSFRQNMDQVMKQWNCNKPKAQLVYLGKSINY